MQIPIDVERRRKFLLFVSTGASYHHRYSARILYVHVSGYLDAAPLSAKKTSE
jgi:hypothetical protein